MLRCNILLQIDQKNKERKKRSRFVDSFVRVIPNFPPKMLKEEHLFILFCLLPPLNATSLYPIITVITHHALIILFLNYILLNFISSFTIDFKKITQISTALFSSIPNLPVSSIFLKGFLLTNDEMEINGLIFIGKIINGFVCVCIIYVSVCQFW